MRLVALTSFLLALAPLAHADVAAIPQADRARSVAEIANDIFAVTRFRIGRTAYKAVSMNSALNGDLSDTTILLVQEGGVGGEAGYENAFQLTPNLSQDLRALRSVKASGKRVVCEFSRFSSNHALKKTYEYDAAARTLKEIE